jgi:hypothetical protein
LKADHADDVFLSFGMPAMVNQMDFLLDKHFFTEKDKSIDNIIVHYWANFAKNG